MSKLNDKFPSLNFPEFSFKFSKKEGQIWVWDDIRKKNLLLTPEEWVRQHVVRFMQEVLNYPATSISIEGMLSINQQTKRYDVLAYTDGKPQILVECKAARIKITQDTFDQIARYNMALNVPYLWVTNGLQHFFATVDYKNEKYVFIKELPVFRKD